MSQETKRLAEFHYFPKLPAELQEMVWALYSKSLPVMRHNFHIHKDPRGTKSYHYILYDGQARFFTNASFRYQQDELSSVHGALTVPQAIFPFTPCITVTNVGSKKEYSVHLSVNYEKDIFNFSMACCNSALPYGEFISDWFRIPFQPMPVDLELSPGTEKNNKEVEIGNETQENDDEGPKNGNEEQHRIFSARRIAFYAPIKFMTDSLPSFQDSDMQILAEFKRLKEIIFVVERVFDAPISMRERARSMQDDQHKVFGGLMTIAYLNSEECLTLFNGDNKRVSVQYALDLAMYPKVPDKSIFD
ncbi:hypothetical protein GGR51DRAFT_565732 [Nemania sp. FL0031]|nr:hypothetical protein GGR51DRAFT_565732 [Nemania sp. FL0031]